MKLILLTVGKGRNWWIYKTLRRLNWLTGFSDGWHGSEGEEIVKHIFFWHSRWMMVSFIEIGNSGRTPCFETSEVKCFVFKISHWYSLETSWWQYQVSKWTSHSGAQWRGLGQCCEVSNSWMDKNKTAIMWSAKQQEVQDTKCHETKGRTVWFWSIWFFFQRREIAI